LCKQRVIYLCKFAHGKLLKQKTNFLQSKLNTAFLQLICFWQVQGGIKLGAKVFCSLPGASTVPEAGKPRVVWQILYNAIFGEGHRLRIE
jgi:hypothetical protein